MGGSYKGVCRGEVVRVSQIVGGKEGERSKGQEYNGESEKVLVREVRVKWDFVCVRINAGGVCGACFV